MRDRPLVSIVTGCIPSRLDLLYGAMANIREQSYPNLEHCIAFEGEPPYVENAVAQIRKEAADMDDAGRAVPTRVTGLGRWWSRFLAASMSTVPFQVAQWMAAGDYLCWWADDERALTPEHISRLVSLLEATSSDFAYPRVRLVPAPGIPMEPNIIGTDPPYKAQVTHCLFRAELLDYRGFTTHVGSATDWDQIGAWIGAGARWAMLDEVTFQHRLDKLDEGPDFRSERQPLRGQQERAGACFRLPISSL